MPLANECHPFIEDSGQPRLTGHVATAVTGKRLVAITGRQAGPGLNTSTGGGNFTIAPCGAGAPAAGVAAYDGAVGAKVPVIGAPGTVLPITAGTGGVTAGQRVESDATGKVIPLATGAPIGICLVGAAANADAEIRLY